MTLSRPEPLFEPYRQVLWESSATEGELTHVSEVLAESGIPVADSLKELMLDEMLRLMEEQEITALRN